MIKNTFYLCLLITFLMISCKSGYQYWELSKFNIDINALEDNEEIKLLYSSRGADNNKELKYYYHIIAVSQKTGDTVNILTTMNNGFPMGTKDKTYNFINENNFAYKLIEREIAGRKEIENTDDIKKIDKVARDPEFDHIADNNYPTIIGFIGITSQE